MHRENTLTFCGGKLIIKRRIFDTGKVTYHMVCQCGKEVRIYGSRTEYWVAKCGVCKVEYIITPGQFFTEFQDDGLKEIVRKDKENE